jgi:light-regulated signal transduction histidine kinase (bacteriophytochrome)
LSELSPQASQYIAYAVNGAQRMETLLKDLREYWSVDEQKVERLVAIDCNAVFDAVISNMNGEIATARAMVTRKTLPTVLAEPYPLTLLFQNTIGNAIKYRRADAAPEVRVSAHRNGAGWIFSVADNGIGIEAEHLEAIFAPFKRLHGSNVPGTGLGLAMCQRIVQRYNGKIWVESVYGQGSTFRFSLSGPDGGGQQ